VVKLGRSVTYVGLAALTWSVGCTGERFENADTALDNDAGDMPSATATGDQPAATNTSPTDTAPDPSVGPSPDGTGPAEPSSTPSTGGTAPTPTGAVPGVHCSEAATGRLRAFFEVPGAEGAQLDDFFRLPYPNDFYANSGQLTLDGFPAVTAIAENFVTAVEQTADGFSASPTIYFRFSGKVDFDTLVQRFHLLDITDPEQTSSPPLKLLYSPSSGKYLCHNALAARPAPGHALLPGHTYAAWIEQGVLTADGLEVVPSEQLQAVLGAEAPADGVLASLHTKFAPLRDYFEYATIGAEGILNATVFTVGNVRDPLLELSEQVAALPAPASSAWTRCDGVTPSPCPDATGNRQCGAPTPDYTEYHALVELPIFQEGDPPYFAGGGQINTTTSVRTENVCMSLTVPNYPAPADGFPVVLTAHGAGGSFRSHVREEVAGRLSRGVDVDGQVVAFAVLGYDGVQHGPRRGNDPTASGSDPELLLFNFLNPVGTLGTSLQGGVDVLSMARFAKVLQVPSTDGGQLLFDTSRVMFWGHSQGAMQAAIALPYTDDITAAVFSGLGAGFLQTLLLRKDPELIPQAVASAVFDPGQDGDLVFGGQFHPALSLVQHLVDPADPLHHAKFLAKAPQTSATHVFQVYGVADGYSPGIAQQSFGIAAGLAIVQPDPSAEGAETLGVPSESFPLMGNLTNDNEPITAGVRQYGPAADANGHFVAFEVPSAGQDVAVFLATAQAHEAPQIGQ